MAVGMITKRAVDALKPSASDQYLWDDEVSGFGLKVTPKGARTYLLQYRIGGRGSPTRRFTIGRHGTWTPDEARKEARRLRQMVDRGIDPQAAQLETLKAAAQRKREHDLLGFESYVKRFLSEYGKQHWRPGTYRNADAAFRLYVLPKLREDSLLTITRADITGVLDGIPAAKKALRRAVYAYLRKLFSWSVGRGDLDRSPMEGMPAPAAVASRDRVLTDDELRLTWAASHAVNATFGAVVRVLTLTAQRRDEVAGMDWRELDRKARLWTIPGDRAKNKNTHLVPLSAAVVAELDEIAKQAEVDEAERKWPQKGFVFTSNGRSAFSGFSKAKAALDRAMRDMAAKAAAKPGFGEEAEWRRWTLHDLRRTVSTNMQQLGIRFEVTEAVLNHLGGYKSGVAGVYQRHDWKEEKRSALDAWALRLAAILASEPQGGNVVNLAERRL